MNCQETFKDEEGGMEYPCGGEMRQVGTIDTGKKDAYNDGEGNAWVRDIKQTLYQCESCKTIKLN